MPRTSPSGHPRIQQELSAMEHELDNLLQQSETAIDVLTQSQTQWQAFDDLYQQFVVWLDSKQEIGKDKGMYKDTLEEKQKQLDDCKVSVYC